VHVNSVKAFEIGMISRRWDQYLLSFYCDQNRFQFKAATRVSPYYFLQPVHGAAIHKLLALETAKKTAASFELFSEAKHDSLLTYVRGGARSELLKLVFGLTSSRTSALSNCAEYLPLKVFLPNSQERIADFQNIQNFLSKFGSSNHNATYH